jgi:hypothetical protein
MIIQRTILDPITGVCILVGDGLPDLDAPVSSIYVRRDGGASTTTYAKTGSGTTDWEAFSASTGGTADWSSITGIPAGLVSGSIQVDHDATTNFVANKHIDHTTVNITAGNGLSGGGNISQSRTLTLDTGSTHFNTGVKTKLNTDGVVSSSAQITAALPSGLVSQSSQILHNQTTGYVLAEHTDHTSITMTAGNGLSGGGNIAGNRTFTLDTGSTHFTNGVKTKLNADSVISSSGQVNHNATANYVANEHVDHTAVTISAGAGMSGGGNITATRTLTLDTGSNHFITGSTNAMNLRGVYSSSAQVLHNATTGYVLTEHTDHTSITMTAGSGLSGGGNIAGNRTFTLDTGSTHFTNGVKTKLNTDGVVSSSAQINHDATTNYSANRHIDHSAVTISAGAGMSGGGNITETRTLTLDTSSGHFTNGVKAKMNADGIYSSSLQVLHNQTTGYVLAEHTDHTSITMTAGSGLSGGGNIAGNRTFTLDTGSAHFTNGVKAKMNADSVISSSAQVNHNATTNYVANEHIDHTTVTISAGAGMSGGGNITTTRTLTLDTGSTHFTNGVKTKMNTDQVASGSAAELRTRIGATTVGSNLITLPDSTTIRYPRINNDNTISSLTAANLLSDIGAVALNKTETIDGVKTFSSTIVGNITGNAATAGNATTVTNGVYTTDTGTVTNTMLAGGIANDRLTNSSVTVTAGTGLSGGGSVALGSSITLNNAGVTSAVAGTGISVTSGTGAVTINNTAPNATHTGDVTGATALTIANDAVTNGKLANMAANTIKGRITGGTGDPEDLSASQVRTILNVADGATANTGTVTSVTVSAGTGMSGGGTVTTSGTITLNNTGVTSAAAGTGISVSAGSGAVTIGNTGVTSAVAGTGVSVSAGTGAVTISIGQAVGTSNNVQFQQIGAGLSPSGWSNGEIRATNNITAYASSDRRLKENISNITDPIAKLSQLNGVQFDWTQEFIDTHGGEDGVFIRKHDVGVIAQEVQQILPEVVTTREDGYLAVRYEKLVPLLIEAIKELKNEINILKGDK